ncbi:adenosylmethionine--8-amino-7-oxononanoate transaminase [Chryseosolibacter indicus]|uniref:Adenosylmethionine-8-amino-7-oxononanoate aminotransferase n=1 Tax=Chryseosolibacter indicus TaxID=2782351 RepID=A0ABS5VU89_9BACT|nr:adenosylmethionine--8-amino-7-oxononanoate transaminase [Chryseosolibacter indicus]MBT1704988.1 adenosylmethionine--8-amino-7-oxononanoate transaminase [Chryseosolibacter indicus]
MNLLTQDKNNIWHPFTSLKGADDPILIESGEGVYLKTHDGKKIIDAVSSWWVNIHGHSHPAIAKAIAEQALKLEHVIFAGFTHEPAIKLSENVLTILPDNQSKIFFSDNGSTAVEVGIKMALQYWHNQGIERKKIIAIDGAYHGDTFGAMSVGERSIFTAPFQDHLFQTIFIDFPNAENEEIVYQRFQQLVVEDNVAAFIYEPLVQGAAGMRMYSSTLLDKMIGFAQEHDVICIADEVFTGFGRTGELFASYHMTYKPDIMAISKGLSGGTLPIGITSCSKKIVGAFDSSEVGKTFFHGHSFTANPLACAASNASFELLMKAECRQNILKISSLHRSFKERIEQSDKLADVRSLGTVLAVELRTDTGTSYTSPVRKKIYPYFLERGILLRPLGNIIYILPPYVIKEDELKFIYDEIEKFINNEL